MVGFKATSIALLFGSAALTSAAAVPRLESSSSHLEGKRAWRGRHGPRGPWREDNQVEERAQDQPHYLINIDLSGDGAKQHGVGDLIDLNTRKEAEKRGLIDTPFDPKTDSEKKDSLLKWHLQKGGAGGSGKGKRHGEAITEGVHNLIDIGASIRTALNLGRRSAFVDLVGEMVNLNPTKRDWDEFDSLAKSLGVSDDQIAQAKKVADEKLTPEQQVDVKNAVKHAVWNSQAHGERANMPGPAFLFRARDVEEEVEAEKREDHEVITSLLNVDAKIKVLGQAPEGETGVMSTESETKHGQPLVVAGAKRDMEEEMGGAPGYIDITSPVFNSTAQRIASLVLSTNNGSDTNSSFVLNASSNIRTQVYLVPIKATDAENGKAPGEMIRVNLKVPVFVADTATVEPYCATFDPSPESPSPMTVEPCEEEGSMPEGPELDKSKKSQVFLFDPETGIVKPDWNESTAAASMPDPESSSSMATPDAASSSSAASSSTPAAPMMTSSAAAVPSMMSSIIIPGSSSAVSMSSASAASTGFAAKAADASSVHVSVSPSFAAPSASPTPVEAYPSDTTSIPVLPLISSAQVHASVSSMIPSSYHHTASAPILPSPSSVIGAAASSVKGGAGVAATSKSASMPLPMPSAPSSMSAPAPSASASLPVSASAPAAVPSGGPSTSEKTKDAPHGNNVTLIFTPSQASVLSEKKENATSQGFNLHPESTNGNVTNLTVPVPPTEEDVNSMTPVEPKTASAQADNEDASVEEVEAEHADEDLEDGEHGDLESSETAELSERDADCTTENVESLAAAQPDTKTTKPKAKLPEGQEGGDAQKISIGKGAVAVENASQLKSMPKSTPSVKPVSSQMSRLGARYLRRQQTVMRVPDFAPYDWTWTPAANQ